MPKTKSTPDLRAELKGKQDAIDHLKAMLRKARAANGQLTKRHNEDWEHFAKMGAEERRLKDQNLELVQLLVPALLALDSYTPNEVAYLVKTYTEDKLIAMFPAVAGRLGRDTKPPATAVNEQPEQVTDGNKAESR